MATFVLFWFTVVLYVFLYAVTSIMNLAVAGFNVSYSFGDGFFCQSIDLACSIPELKRLFNVILKRRAKLFLGLSFFVDFPR